MSKVLIHKMPKVAIAILTAGAISASSAAAFDQSGFDSLAQSNSHLKQDAAKQDAVENNLEDTEAESEESTLVSVPGTSVSLVPPPGFMLSEQFSGFEHPETFSSIVLAELPPEAYADIAATFSSTPEEISAAFASQGIMLEVESVSSFAVGDVQVPFIEGLQTVGDTQIKKYFALIEGENTLLLTFNVIDTTQLQADTIVETVQSVEVRPAPTIQQKVEELPFTFSAADPFQIFEVLAGSSVILSVNGEADPSEETPLIVIANSVSAVQTADLAAFSAQLLQRTEGFEDSTIVEQSFTTFAGEEGTLTRATVDDETILQYLAILPDGFYIRMVVISHSDRLAEIMPAVQTIQSSIAAK